MHLFLPLLIKMDTNDILKLGGVSTGGVAILLIVYRILKYVNGKRIKSECCGQTITMGVSVEEMNPVKNISGAV